MGERKLILSLVIILGILVGIVGFFFPKKVGGNLCGPLCLPYGLHYYEQGCLGLKRRSEVIDAYSDICYGLPIGEKRCFGVPYESVNNSKDIQLDCNYERTKYKISKSCTQDSDCPAGLVCTGRGPTQPSKETPGVCLPSKASQSTY